MPMKARSALRLAAPLMMSLSVCVGAARGAEPNAAAQGKGTAFQPAKKPPAQAGGAQAGSGPTIGAARTAASSPTREALIKEHGLEAVQVLDQAIQAAKAEVPGLEGTIAKNLKFPQSGGMLANVPIGLKERLQILKRLAALDLDKAGDVDISLLLTVIKVSGSDPLYKVLKPKLFLAYLLGAFDALDKAQEEKGTAHQRFSALSPSNMVALFGYTTIDFVTINKALRTKQDNENLRIYAKAVTDGIERAPLLDERNPVMLTMRVETKTTPDYAPGYYPDGGITTLTSFTSTSADVQGFSKMTNPTNPPPGQYVITVKGRARDISGVSAHATEAEVLYPPGARFKVEWDKSAPNKNVIHLTEDFAPPVSPADVTLSQVRSQATQQGGASKQPVASGQTGNAGPGVAGQPADGAAQQAATARGQQGAQKATGAAASGAGSPGGGQQASGSPAKSVLLPKGAPPAKGAPQAQGTKP